MLTAALPKHLLAYADFGLIRTAHVRAIVAFQEDAAASYSDGRERGGRRAPDNGGYTQDNAAAVARAERARQAMGRQRTQVMRLVGIDAMTFQEAAVELGYRQWEDVRQQFQWAAGNLLHVYNDFANAA